VTSPGYAKRGIRVLTKRAFQLELDKLTEPNGLKLILKNSLKKGQKFDSFYQKISKYLIIMSERCKQTLFKDSVLATFHKRNLTSKQHPESNCNYCPPLKVI